MSSRACDGENLRKAAPYRTSCCSSRKRHREGSDVPADVPAGYPVPRAIVEHPPNGVRRDIRSFATSERLHVLYVPAMRNGTTAVA